MENKNQNTTKAISFNELGEIAHYNATTIRSWARKPIIGEAYDPNKINYDFINSQLDKVANLKEIEKEIGGKLGVDVMIEKSLKNVGGSVIKLQPSQMEVGTTYLVISHVNRFHYTLKGVAKVDDENVYIFQDERYGEFKKTQDAYRALSESELASERWTIRELTK